LGLEFHRLALIEDISKFGLRTASSRWNGCEPRRIDLPERLGRDDYLFDVERALADQNGYATSPTGESGSALPVGPCFTKRTARAPPGRLETLRGQDRKSRKAMPRKLPTKHMTRVREQVEVALCKLGGGSVSAT
jgi:hypothetical protein